MIRPKFGDRIGCYYLTPKLDVLHIIDSCWKSYIIAVDMGNHKYKERYKKTMAIPASWVEIHVTIVRDDKGSSI